MRVLAACSLGGAGHLGPLRPFLDAARRSGHETVVVAPPAMAAMVEATGHTFVPGGEPAEADIAPIREQLPVLRPDEASVLGNRELFGRLAARAMLPFMAGAVDGWRPDLILRDPCEYASAVVAASAGVPVAQVAISFAEAEWGSIAAAAPALDEYRPGLADVVRATPYWTRFPAVLDPSPFPTTVRTREAAGRAPHALPRWWGHDDRRMVYVTFGTVLGHMTSAGTTFAVVVNAVAGVDARVLLTVGPAFDPHLLGPVPAHVHVEQWVDQIDALATAEAVVCHGGSGTTLGALAAGVPMVVVPLFADQFLNARRVVAAGAGVAVPTGADDGGHRRPLTVDDAGRIRAALEDVLADGAHRRAARRVAGAMASAPAPDEILDAFTT
jgi:UDP:flavonoid glycosyltransferase YjiC (YdhE family)